MILSTRAFCSTPTRNATKSVPGCHRLAALDARKCEVRLRKTARNNRIAFLKTEKGTLELLFHFHTKGT